VLVGGPHPHTGAVRILHRLAASIALLLGFYTAWRCLRPTPLLPVARYATALLTLMIALTFVGVWSSDPHRIWASFFNMLGGLGLVSLSWRTVLAAESRPLASQGPDAGLLLRAGLGLLAASIALGALIGARYAAISCASAPSCGGVWWPAAEGWAALNPFATVAVSTLPGDAGGVTLHLLHRYCALLALIVMGLVALQALAADATRKSGGWLLILLLIEFALGSLTVLSGFSLWLAIGHSVCAAALLAVGIHLRHAVAAERNGG
jgi:cytochrome c oxidase assembly protein subunit 15